jgi:hypothetical protein
LTPANKAGILSCMKNTPKEEYKKITVNVPAKLLKTPAGEELNVTQTVVDGLKWMAHKRACDELIKLRGKVKFLMSWEEIKALR